MNYFGRIYLRTERSFPTGPGSRSGRWHHQWFRAQYHREWRAAHPEYMERERLRQHNKVHPGTPLPPRRED
jgi:hypothetical protein